MFYVLSGSPPEISAFIEYFSHVLPQLRNIDSRSIAR